MKLNKLSFLIALSFSSSMLSAETTLKAITISTEIDSNSITPFTATTNLNNVIVDKEQLQTRSSSLGNALSQELGIHSNQFGGMASSPIIRGQEGVRIKILQNSSDVIDMSQLSPDHAVGVDTLLSSHIEVVRGPSTLLYANASPAGVINVEDNRILKNIPSTINGDVSFRYNTNSNEKATTTGLTLPFGEYFAFRIEGLKKDAHNYHVPEFNLGKMINYVPDTQNKTKAGNLGITFAGKYGYIGASFNERRENYGIPGHNHKMDGCIGHIVDANLEHNFYLGMYPHLMDDSDMVNPHFHCGDAHSSDGAHSHNNPYGYKHNFNMPGPHIESNSRRKDVKGEWRIHSKNIDKIRFAYSRTDYHHNENDDGFTVNIFHHKGENMRLELFHEPIKGLKGVIGFQKSTKSSDANIPRIPSCSNNFSDPCHKAGKKGYDKLTEADRKKWALPHNKEKQDSFFIMEQYQWNNWLFEAAFRQERQTIKLDFDRPFLLKRQQFARGCDSSSWLFYNPRACKDNIKYNRFAMPDLSGYKDTANSWAAGVSWEFIKNHTLSFNYSHNERNPSPMELYYHGNHIATSSFEYGNKELKKERSNNYEVGLNYLGEKLSYQISVYYNDFANRIFNQTLAKEGNLSLNRYNQSKATYYGAEGRIDYAFTNKFSAGLFADFVRGKLYDLPDRFKVDHFSNTHIPIPQADQNAPRVPPARVGFRAYTHLTEYLSTDLDYTYAFKQNKVAPLENKTGDYHLLNAGLYYNQNLKDIDMKLFIKGNNLLNQKIYSHTSYLPFVPQMGRNFMLGVDFNF